MSLLRNIAYYYKIIIPYYVLLRVHIITHYYLIFIITFHCYVLLCIIIKPLLPIITSLLHYYHTLLPLLNSVITCYYKVIIT